MLNSPDATDDGPVPVDDRTAPVRSVSRASDLLLALGNGPMHLGDLSTVSGLSKPTVHRILSTLKMKGLVVQDRPTGRYTLGPACFRLMFQLVHGAAGFSLDADNVLRRLWEDTLETVTVHIRVGAARLCIDELPSRQAIRYTSGIGETAPIQVGSAGKALLAFLPEEDREAILSSVRPVPLTDHTITDLGVLRRELAEIAESGLAFSEGERIEGAAAVSAPILYEDGHAIAALSVLGPVDRMGPARLARHGELARRAAAQISANIYVRPTRS